MFSRPKKAGPTAISSPCSLRWKHAALYRAKANVIAALPVVKANVIAALISLFLHEKKQMEPQNKQLRKEVT